MHGSLVGNVIRLGNFGPDWDEEFYVDYIRAGVVGVVVATREISWAVMKALFR
jgi:hypothetical protein